MMYRVYDKNAGPDDLAIKDFFTEEGAQTEVTRQAEKGREAAYEPFTPRCAWGSAYESMHCPNEATWFQAEAGWGCYGAECDEHHQPEQGIKMCRQDEKARQELGQGKAPTPTPAVTQSQAGFWFKDR